MKLRLVQPYDPAKEPATSLADAVLHELQISFFDPFIKKKTLTREAYERLKHLAEQEKKREKESSV